MSIKAAEKASRASFLDRREARILHFVKYHGLGNDFILVDNRDSSEPKITAEQAAKLCDRNFGIGADGVIFALPGINGTDYTMRISIPTGVSLRCVAMESGALADSSQSLRICMGSNGLQYILVLV
ncbi:hypothetical protein M0R45_030495 [Rubus argutus]|uniref:Diaminopimelate epimerase n=1 Tax=Rubus argutus TaxID=59490 RepID=A0AAW1WDR1_RUBAR